MSEDNENDDTIINFLFLEYRLFFQRQVVTVQVFRLILAAIIICMFLNPPDGPSPSHPLLTIVGILISVLFQFNIAYHHILRSEYTKEIVNFNESTQSDKYIRFLNSQEKQAERAGRYSRIFLREGYMWASLITGYYLAEFVMGNFFF